MGLRRENNSPSIEIIMVYFKNEIESCATLLRLSADGLWPPGLSRGRGRRGGGKGPLGEGGGLWRGEGIS